MGPPEGGKEVRQLLFFGGIAYLVVSLFVAVGYAMHGSSRGFSSEQAAFDTLGAGFSWPWYVLQYVNGGALS